MDNMERLYEASLEGNVSILLMLLHEDPLILDKVTLNRNHSDMPLHVASMLGHIDFVKEIINRKPHFAMECDSQKRLPLHIASAKGHVDIVKVLVSANPEACHARDREGGNPIHLAAIKGHFDVVKELLRNQPHAARAMVDQETILHLCVKYSQLEVLKLLIESMAGDHEFINSRDFNGNTILHLAVADKQVETTKFLVLDTTIEVNATNTNGETPMDILAQVPRDLKYQQIIWSLTRAGAIEAKPQGSFDRIPTNSRNDMGLERLSNYQNPPATSHLKKHETWLEQKRGTLMVVASLIAAMAFQAGINPPGGVWQEEKDGNGAGYAIMATKHYDQYFRFLISNTVGFVSTLSIIMLLISGLPIFKTRFSLWVLMIIMWIATTSMSYTYLLSIWMLIPTPEPESYSDVVACIVYVWIGLVTLLLVGHTVRLIYVTLRGFIRLLRRLIFPKRRMNLVPIIR